MSRRRAVNKESHIVPPPPDAVSLNGSAGGETGGPKAAVAVAGALLDYSLMLFLVFGGCCSYVPISRFANSSSIDRDHLTRRNVWAYEGLLRAEPNVGASRVTFIK